MDNRSDNCGVNRIGFSHRYGKMHGQTSGILLRAIPYVIDRRWVTEETIVYDTDGKFPLPDGRYLQLVFLGDKQIPFTTYRTDDDEHRRRFCGHEMQVFEFHFKTTEEARTGS